MSFLAPSLGCQGGFSQPNDFTLQFVQLDALAATAQTFTSTEVKFNFRLGQKIRHARLGYRGVICGMDWQCFESSEWMEKNGVDKLQRGRQQPFYQLLVDMQQSPSTLVAYVAEENIEAPEEDDEVNEGASFSSIFLDVEDLQ